jgi:hypothetical protein|tara:strand:+ start:16 stop:387 length:372 start_codon:yes stop_codon:yes gene_type:complete
MSLSLIFRLQAAFAAMWALQLVFVPNMVFAQYGWAPSFELVALAQACGTAMAGLAIINYGLPKWTTEDQLKMAAKSAGLIAVLFSIMQLHQILVSHAAPGAAMDWISTIITIGFAALFFLKSK